ncbi:hypothetical protein AB0L05_40135, partial [Nonomuraea pusilla]|uniref:hypothetical protein n=1 Tax=Nonomuraea pusilla TaxID=46177 RepID=UPI00332D8280
GEVSTRHVRWPTRATGRAAGNPSDLNSVQALAVSAAGMIAYSMKVPHRREAIPLGDPGQAELAGAAAMIIVWGAVALLVMGSYGMTRQARGRSHHAWVEESDQDGRYVAACACGWRGKVAQDSSAVFADAGDHANRVEIAIRKVSGLPSKSP